MSNRVTSKNKILKFSMYKKIKSIIAENFPMIWKLLRLLKDSLIISSRLKDVFMMMLLFHIWPEQTYRFSTRKLLPCQKNRFSKNIKPQIPYDLLNSKSSKISTMKEINVVGLGSSFDLNHLRELEAPTFLLSYWVPLKIDDNGNVIYLYDTVTAKNHSKAKHPYNINNLNILKEFKKKNLTYVIGREQHVKSLIKEGCNVLSIHVYNLDEEGQSHPLSKIWEESSYLNMFNDNNLRRISIAEKIYQPPLLKPYSNWAPSGSFLPALCALSYYAKKINVYGWDFYLESSPKNMNYWEVLFNTYKYSLDTERSKYHFEQALINFYYAYQFSKLPNFNFYCHLGQLDKYEKLIKKIERVLFN